jgi:hypothetical protein
MAQGLCVKRKPVKLRVFLEEHLLEHIRKILAAKEIIPRHGAHLQNAVNPLQHGHIEGAAP